MFEDYLAVLAVILMAKHGNKIVVTQDEIADARRALADNEIQAVAYDTDRLVCGDRVAIEFRYRSRRVLEGGGGGCGPQTRPRPPSRVV